MDHQQFAVRIISSWMYYAELIHDVYPHPDPLPSRRGPEVDLIISSVKISTFSTYNYTVTVDLSARIGFAVMGILLALILIILVLVALLCIYRRCKTK